MRRCRICEARIYRRTTKICQKCYTKGPYGHDDSTLIAKACKGQNAQGKPCSKWSLEDSDYCAWHGKDD